MILRKCIFSLLITSALAQMSCGNSIDTDKRAENNTMYSNIKTDETIVFFRTSAWLDESKNIWHVPIHGWVYEPQNSQVRKAAFSKLLQKKYNLSVSEENQEIFDRRVNLLLADNERNKKVIVKLGEKLYLMPSSEANGHFTTILEIRAEELSPDEHGLIRYEAFSLNKTAAQHNNMRTFSGESLLLSPHGHSVISDIDDTVKTSHVTDRKNLLNYTFLKDFEAVDNMADLYRSWEENGTSFHYVSSCPWQLYLPLNDFLDNNRFPWATVTLKSIRFKDKSLSNLFKKGSKTKPPEIEVILKSYPQRTFTLVGDSGEQDAEVYAGIYKKHPNQIKKIYIRNISSVAESNSAIEHHFKGIDKNKWMIFSSPAEIVN